MARRGWQLPSSRAGSVGPPELNLTPLIDVVFVVLICFILIAPLLELEQIELASSGSSSRPLNTQERAELKVHVRADNSIRVNDQLVLERNLPKVLQFWRQRIKGQAPQVFCDRRAHFGTYQTLKGALEKSGYSTVDLIVIPSDSMEPRG